MASSEMDKVSVSGNNQRQTLFRVVVSAEKERKGVYLVDNSQHVLSGYHTGQCRDRTVLSPQEGSMGQC